MLNIARAGEHITRLTCQEGGKNRQDCKFDFHSFHDNNCQTDEGKAGLSVKCLVLVRVCFSEMWIKCSLADETNLGKVKTPIPYFFNWSFKVKSLRVWVE